MPSQPAEPRRARVTLATWQELLAEARSVVDVVAIANEYLTRLEQFEVMWLPAACKPRPLTNSADVNVYAVDLKRCKCASPQEAEVVARVAVFFLEAADRLAHLSGPANRYHLPRLYERE